MPNSFWSFASEQPDHLAVVDPDGSELRAGALHARCNAIVHGLRALGLAQGDCFAVVLPNSSDVLALHLAATQAGFYMTPINHHLTTPEIAYILGDCEAKAIVVHEHFATTAGVAAREADIPEAARLAVGAIDGFHSFDAFVTAQHITPPSDRAAGSVMFYTSGTTGRPKGVRRALAPLDPDTVASLFSAFPQMFGITPRDGNVHLCGSPLYHTAVLTFASCSLHLGHTVVLMEKWTPEGCLRLIAQRRVTTSHMVPTQFHRLLALPDAVSAKYDVSSLRHMIHAAAPCPVDTKRRMLAWWGPVIDEYYAATEGGGTRVSAQDWLAHPGTVGRAWPGAQIRVLDDEGKECPAGTPGTVYMALGAAAFEYHKDRAKTESSRREGFFTVGDVGYLDEAGWLFLCDRKTDMIISGGVNIYPAEIEAALLQHPAVGDVAVFGIPDTDWGEQVKAVVEPAPGATAGDALATDILAFCADRLAKYKTPKSIDFVEALPRDPNGKLYKRRLRDPYWQGRERAI